MEIIPHTIKYTADGKPLEYLSSLRKMRHFSNWAYFACESKPLLLKGSQWIGTMNAPQEVMPKNYREEGQEVQYVH